jgi:alpha-beta hydrolase superfamily lysophospholipase
MAKEFSKIGYDFFTFDIRGHGRSDGSPGLVKSISQTADDFHKFMLLSIEKYYPD